VEVGRLLADYAWNLINLYGVSVTSLAGQVNVYGLGNDYALYEVTGGGVDTVGVWGSNPHAPTNIDLSPFLIALIGSSSKQPLVGRRILKRDSRDTKDIRDD
jgi:hypothetical protein